MRRTISAVRMVGISTMIILIFCGPASAQTPAPSPAQPPPSAQTPPAAQPQPSPQAQSPAKGQPPAQTMSPAAGGGAPRTGAVHREPGGWTGQYETGQLGPLGSGFMGTLHRWAALLFTRSAEINLTVPQRQEIEAIFFSHLKYAIPKQAERRVMILDIEQSLTREQPDLNAVEQKVKAVEALDTDMTMEGIRILQKALGALNPEQRSTMKGLFRESLYGEMRGGGGMSSSGHP